MALPHAIVPSTFGRWWDCFDYPTCIWDQNFGTVLSETDLRQPQLYRGYRLQPRTQMAEQASGTSEVENNKDVFRVKLTVSHFKPGELEVKVVDNYIVILGQHDERPDDYGFIQRKFSRRYMLPDGTEAETIKSSMSKNGVLTVEAPKKLVVPRPPSERVVPIEMLVAPELISKTTGA